MDEARLTVSIVSHGHGTLVSELLNDLAACPEVQDIILTLNIPEPEIVVPGVLADRIRVVQNEFPRGFGQNHNAAFSFCEAPYFCVLNPDVRLPENPFPPLLGGVRELALAAPLIINPAGEIEDSARRFPDPVSLLLRLLGLQAGTYDIDTTKASIHPDWVAGMFMLFNARAYAALGGFDPRYFLYCEDIDICARLRRQNLEIGLFPSVKAVHDARRDSRRRLRYMLWHVTSLLRFFLLHAGRLPTSRVA